MGSFKVHYEFKCPSPCDHWNFNAIVVDAEHSYDARQAALRLLACSRCGIKVPLAYYRHVHTDEVEDISPQ
jgi:hypothetical protein